MLGRTFISPALHCTIVFYSRDTVKMAQAARILSARKHPDEVVRVRLTRLGRVVAEEGKRVLAWASLDVPGFEGQAMHVTLVAEGFKAFLAKACEEAYESGRVELEGATYTLERIPISHIDVDSQWTLL